MKVSQREKCRNWGDGKTEKGGNDKKRGEMRGGIAVLIDE